MHHPTLIHPPHHPMLSMMNRNHGPNGPPGPPPPPHRYPPPPLPPHAGPLPPHGAPLPPAPGDRRGAPVVSMPGPLERAIAAARHPNPAASMPMPPPARAVRPGMAPVAADRSSAPAAQGTASANQPGAVGSSSSSGSPPPSASKPRYKKRTKKYNNFNIFFMLERQLLLQSRGGGIDAVENPIDTSDSPLVRHKELHLPPLCRRYNHLPLTNNWFLELLANQNKKRPHRKSHGLIPFKELAQTVAKNYREIDDETQSFVNEVAERLGWHCEEMEAIEARERREQEDKDRAMGRHPVGHGGKKRKDAPVVSVAGAKGAVSVGGLKPGGLSQDEAATVQQLMGMKANSPSSAPPPRQGPRDFHPQMHHPAHHPQAPPHQAFPPVPHHPQAFPPARRPMVNPVSDIESERLRIELARAMNARRDSEQRIQLLKEQMTLHNARAQQDQHRAAAAQAADQYLASLLGQGPPHSPSRSRLPEPTRDHASEGPGSLRDMERALLKEALARRLIPPGAPLDALYRGQHPPPAAARAAEAPSSSRSSSAPLKKRQRFSYEQEDGDAKMPSEEKSEGSAGEPARPRSSSYDVAGVARAAASASENRPASASADEIGFYKDLYANLLGPRGHHPRQPQAPSPLSRDEALLDGLAHSLGGSSRSSAVEQALLEGLARRGVGNRRPPSPRGLAPRYPPAPARYPPPSPGGTASSRGPDYAALLSRLAAGRNRPSYPTEAPPARDGASSPSRQGLLDMVHAASQFGLSYGDIMDVWRQMNRDEGGGAGQEEGKSEREEERRDNEEA